MKKKNIKTTRKRNKKRILGSIGLAALIFSGASIMLPNADEKSLTDSGFFKMVQNNPDVMLKGLNIDLDRDFDYIDELNNQFSDKVVIRPGVFLDFFPSMNEGAVFDALYEGNYDAWKEAIKNLEGYPDGVEPISEDEFNTLVEIRKNSDIVYA